MKYWWTDYPWRLIQTNLREIDMLDIDARTYVESLRSFDATVVMINTSGILASYPTRLPFHFQSPYLKGDSLKTIIDECHRAGIKVIARTDFSKIRRPIYEQHPEWAYVSPQGNIVDYNGDVHACVNGGFQQSYMFDILRETLSELDVDGIFFNMGGYRVDDYSHNYHGICHCENCKTLFHQQAGLALPEREDRTDPVYLKYLCFKQESLNAFSRKVFEFLRRLRPDLLVNADAETMDSGFIRSESNTALDRSLPHWPYTASENVKWVRGSYGPYHASNASVDFIDFPVRHVAVSPAQQELRLCQNLANGGGLDYYLIGRLDNHEDQSGYDRIRKMFRFHKDHESVFNQPISMAGIALIRPESDAPEYRGWYRALTEGHFRFDVIAADRILQTDISQYRLLVLPDYRYVSQEVADKLDAAVESGAGVIGSGQTGFYDEQYRKRSTPAIRSLQIEKNQWVKEDCRGAMFKIRDSEYPLLGRFSQTEQLIFLDGAYLFSEYAEDTQLKLAYIPPHPFGPPERCYYSQVTELPGVVLGRYGKGQTVYIPWYPGALLHRQGYLNTWNFLVSLLETYGHDCQIRGNISPMVEATLQTDKDRTFGILSLVNGTGHFGVSFFDPVPLSDIRCQVKVDQSPSQITGLVSNRSLSFEYDEESGWLQIDIGDVGMMETAVIDFKDAICV